MRTPADIQASLLAVGPQGPMWQGAVWAALLLALASEASRIEGVGDTLLAEAIDPGAAVMMLPDYERCLGPDPYGRNVSVLPMAQRQAIVLQRWTSGAGQSRAFFVALALLLGVAITITEISIAQCNGAESGAATCGRSPSEFYWIVNLPLNESYFPECGGAACGDAGIVAGSPVQPVIAALAPAHTTPIFTYT